MFGQQVIPNRSNGIDLAFAVSVDGNVAFGVEAERAIVEIRGANPQHASIDDQDLGMDVDRFAMLVERMIDAQPPISIELLQRRHQPRPRTVHR
jgi:hypothetical protein